MAKKVYIHTFGCQMNEADSDEMLSALYARGYSRAENPDEADAVLVNTCSVRAHAEHRAISFIGRMEKWKAAKPGRTLIVAGCAAERLGADMKARFPHVDITAGAKSIDNFPDLLDEAGLHSGESAEESSRSGSRAYVTIMRGCGFACSYCIVPAVRGPVSCRNPQDILSEVKYKITEGADEIILLGQTVNAYRHEKCGDFAALLGLVHSAEGLKSLNFMSPHPLFVSASLINAYAQLPKLERRIHLPAQSGSDRMLSMMSRGYGRVEFLGIVEKLRTAVPDIAISSDFIVGFPSETEEDFRQTLSLAREAGLESAYCFKFSPRQGTAAWDMPGAVAEEEKEHRLSVLLELVRSLKG